MWRAGNFLWAAFSVASSMPCLISVLGRDSTPWAWPDSG